MQFEMVMPKMGESITDGTVIKWLKKIGDVIEKDEIILEISTDKVDSEIPTPVSGTLVKLLAEEGETVDVGVTIALIETENIDTAMSTAEQTVVEEKVATVADDKPQTTQTVEKKTLQNKESNRFYSPVVMNIATKNNIDFAQLETIPGSGLNGRVSKKDILNYLENTKGKAAQESSTHSVSSSGPVEIIEMDHIRKSIAKHMIASKQTSAHVSLYAEVDMQNISTIRERNKEAFKKKEDFSLTYMPFIAEATILALKEYPMLNASIDGDTIVLKHFINLGIAVAVENGLIVPNLFNADTLNLRGLSRGINDLALRARTKKLKPDEISNGTFSISNFGVYGTSIGFPIINQPQVAILGVGAIKKRPVVINDAIAIRPILYLSLTIDHRLIDGAMGAQFLQRITQILEDYDPKLNV